LFNDSELEKEIVTLLSIVNSSRVNHEMLIAFAEQGHRWAEIYYTEWELIQNHWSIVK